MVESIMLYAIDWSDPVNPRIQATGSAFTGETLDAVVTQIIRHHVEVIRSHCTAIEGIIRDVSS